MLLTVLSGDMPSSLDILGPVLLATPVKPWFPRSCGPDASARERDYQESLGVWHRSLGSQAFVPATYTVSQKRADPWALCSVSVRDVRGPFHRFSQAHGQVPPQLALMLLADLVGTKCVKLSMEIGLLLSKKVTASPSMEMGLALGSPVPLPFIKRLVRRVGVRDQKRVSQSAQLP